MASGFSVLLVLLIEMAPIAWPLGLSRPRLPRWRIAFSTPDTIFRCLTFAFFACSSNRACSRLGLLGLDFALFDALRALLEALLAFCS